MESESTAPPTALTRTDGAVAQRWLRLGRRTAEPGDMAARALTTIVGATGRVFTPDRLATTIKTMADAQADTLDADRAHRADHAAQVIAECERKLARYRAALEVGTDSAIVNQWITEVTVARAAAKVQQ